MFYAPGLPRRARNPAAPSIYPGPHPDGVPMAPQFNGRGSTGGPPSYPGAAMAPAPRQRAAPASMPFMPSPVVTNNPAPFQLSLNRERAGNATRAATFASAAPLPGVPNQFAPNAGENYSGAFGNGPGAYKQAQGARNAFIGGQQDKIDQQDLGPGAGLNSFSNSVNDAYNASHPFISPVDQAKIRASDQWTTDHGIATQSKAAAEGAYSKKQKADAKQVGDLTESKKTAMGAYSQSELDRGEGALRQGEAAVIKANQKPATKIDPSIVKTAGANADAMSKAATGRQDSLLKEFEIKMREATSNNLTREQRARALSDAHRLHNDLEDARGKVDAARQGGEKIRNAATQPSQGQQPGADAVPIHKNPATGERIQWDGQQWQPIA